MSTRIDELIAKGKASIEERERKRAEEAAELRRQIKARVDEAVAGLVEKYHDLLSMLNWEVKYDESDPWSWYLDLWPGHDPMVAMGPRGTPFVVTWVFDGNGITMSWREQPSIEEAFAIAALSQPSRPAAEEEMRKYIAAEGQRRKANETNNTKLCPRDWEGCIGNRCALWVDEHGDCSLRVIARKL